MHKVMTKYILKGSLIALTLVFAVSFSACKKAKDTKAVIIIEDASGAAITGLPVRLYGDPSIPTTSEVRIDLDGVTDGSGVAEFDLTEFFERGQVGVGVLDVFAADSASSPPRVATGVIKIEEEVVNEKTFIAE